jgi:hypothetical protein
VEVDGFAGSATAAIGIYGYLSLQRDSLAQSVQQALDQAEDRLPIMIIYLISRD